MRTGSIILEGGATRGVFTAGVLDYLMEKDLYFSHVIGTSMGACNAVSYVSKQIKRTKDCMIHKDKEHGYYKGLRAFIKERSLLDMEMVFDKYPNEIFLFDYDTYFTSDTICEIVTTNCITGQAEYMTERQDRERFMDICRASSSMPLLSPIVEIDEIPYLDGGIADAIPLERVLEMGNEKIVLVLTRRYGYRKGYLSAGERHLYRKYYSQYPKLLETIEHKALDYNKIIKKIEELEGEGKIFVLRPQEKTISRFERRYDKLLAFYNHGYDYMEEQYEELLKYLDI